MARKKTITREQILAAAYEVAATDGFTRFTAVRPGEGHIVPLNDLPGEQKTPDKPIEHLSGLAHALSQQAVHNPPANLLRAVDAGREGAGFLLLASIRLHPVVGAPRRVRAGLPQGTIQGFQRIGGQPVVRIHKGQIGSPGLSHTQVPGRAHPAVLLVENPYPAVLPGNLVAERAASVWGAIVRWYFGDGNFTVFCAVSGAFVGIRCLNPGALNTVRIIY